MYAASAIAANTITRSACGAAAPLFTNQMFTALGIGGGGSLIGGVATLLAIIPFLFWRYGKIIRMKSKFAPTGGGGGGSGGGGGGSDGEAREKRDVESGAPPPPAAAEPTQMATMSSVSSSSEAPSSSSSSREGDGEVVNHVVVGESSTRAEMHGI